MVEAAMEASEGGKRAHVDRASRWKASVSTPAIFVWGVWLALLWELLSFVTEYRVDTPYSDDWDMVPAVTGHEPISLSWLWSQHNEHRVPLARIAYLAFEKFTHDDFRAGTYPNALLLGAIAAACIVGASRLRGRPSFTDALFPILFLHWGNWENVLLSFQIALLIPVAVSVAMLLLIASSGDEAVSRRSAVAYGCCLITLPLCGGFGLGLVPTLSLWSAYVALVEWRSGVAERRKTARVLGTLTIASVALTGLYFVGYERPATHPPLSGAWWLPLEATLRFLTVGFGPVARLYWPIAGYLVSMLLVATLVAIAWMIRKGRHRTRALGFLAFGVGMVILGGGIAWARIGLGLQNGLGMQLLYASRYAALCAPVLCCVYFAWELSGSPSGAELVQVSLFAMACLLLFRNADDGAVNATKVKAIRQRLLSRAESGASSRSLAHAFARQIYPYPFEDVLEARLRMLHDAGIGAFKSMKTDNGAAK